MRPRIYCLMVFSVSLTGEMADMLFDTASEMLRGNISKRHFAGNNFAGIITTYFEHKAFSGVSGVEFFAEIESALGMGKVKFVLRPFDAKLRPFMVRAPFSSIEDLCAIGLGEDVPGRSVPMYN